MWTPKGPSHGQSVVSIVECLIVLICCCSSSTQLEKVGQGRDFSDEKSRLKRLGGLLIPFPICLPNVENIENAMAKLNKAKSFFDILQKGLDNGMYVYSISDLIRT